MRTSTRRHLHALQLAQACVELGARVRTVHHITRLPRRELIRLFYPDSQSIPRGRPPDSPEWYHTANVLFRADASLVGVLYRRLRHANLPSGSSLIAAYRHYRHLRAPEPRISFDRAFDLAAHLEGIWITSIRSFSVAVCPQCHSEHLTAIGGPRSQSVGCPWCKIIHRYRTDPRVQTSFPTLPLVDPRHIVLGIDLLIAQPPGGGADIPDDPA
ncbi:flagellar transcriptional regulator FlhC [Luteimonas sp. BDR2-5]|uniref:FlhC family transcriptional regulator n=1 Tax=Proluteimonas luteida TaxID=2878685 RepID=UPI001E356CF7|nr:FlhC family transcriptional regulator [Luteimonas sp. BDR2-5]MCD9026748.1 flagellar transcriptional regulator FlhC [Luteimonas sp. BDR2-5]